MLVQQTDYVAWSVWARSNFYPQKAIKTRVVASEKMQCRCTKSREHLILSTYQNSLSTVAELLSSDNSQQGVPFLFFNQGLWAPAVNVPTTAEHKEAQAPFDCPFSFLEIVQLLGHNMAWHIVSMVSIGKKMG